MKCVDCPRACRADRDNGELGYCGGGKFARIAKIIDDFDYEEPCLGTVTAVFFGGCSLGCSYCQNHEISRGANDFAEYSDERLAELFANSRHALDLVTPTHYLSAIERAMSRLAVKPKIIYNTSGYETTDAIERASAFADVFLTDYKYASAEIGAKFSRAPDYNTVAARALAAMRAAVPDEWKQIGGVRILKRGLIVRHLVLPGCVSNSVKALDTIAECVGTDVTLSLMSQFTPNGVGEPSVRLKNIEYKLVAEHAIKLGFENGYFQSFESASAKYVPDFGAKNGE